MPRRAPCPGLVCAVVVAALGLGACGGSPAPEGAARAAAVEPLPTRNPHAQAIEPVAGESAADAALPTQQPGDQPAARPAARRGRRLAAMSATHGNGPTGDAAISDAEVLANGIALPPLEAPDEVRRIVEAGNQIARTPYLWGGGHGRWLDTGYDCSGSISFALAAAGLLSGPLDSGRLMRWGVAGRGKWVTIYTNPHHVFMVVAGVRFDTTGQRSTGSRWQSQMRGTAGFVARHPPRL